MGIRCAPAMKLEAELLVTRATERNRGKDENEEVADENEMNNYSGMYPLLEVL